MSDHNQIKEFLQGWKACEDETFPTSGASDAFIWGWKGKWADVVGESHQYQLDAMADARTDNETV